MNSVQVLLLCLGLAVVANCDTVVTQEPTCPIAPCPPEFPTLCAVNGQRILRVFENSCTLLLENCSQNNDYESTDDDLCNDCCAPTSCDSRPEKCLGLNCFEG